MLTGSVRVTSASHRVLRLARELATPRGRRKRNLVLLEGLRAVESAAASPEAGAAGYSADAESPRRALLVIPRVLAGERGRAVLDALLRAGVPVFEVSEVLFRAVSLVETPQGIALICPPPRVEVAEALRTSFLVVADRLQDPGNLGALFRSARAFGVEAVITTKGTAEAANPKAVRAAAGAWPGLPVAEGADPAELCRGLEGRRILVADAAGGRDFRDPVWRGRVALVLGSEGSGADPRFLAAASAAADAAGSGRVRIPIVPSVESLNVTAAAAVLLAEAARQRRELAR